MAAKNGNAPKEEKPKTDAQVLERVQALVQLAVKNTEGQEARNAAVQAAQLMVEHDLVLVPRAELDKAKTIVAGAQMLAARAKKEKWTNIILGAVGGQVLLGKGGLRL